VRAGAAARFDAPPRPGYNRAHDGRRGARITVGEAVEAGLEALGTLLGCARGLAERVAAPFAPAAAPGTADDHTPEPSADDAGPQERVEEAKFWLGPPPPDGRPRELAIVRDAEAPTVDRETAELPRAYGVDRIALIPRDPWWVFAYWEVTPETRIRALRSLGDAAAEAREILRVYDVTFLTFTGDNAWLSFDVELPAGADRWYLNVSRPAASYCVEVGLHTAGGRFLPLARSNVVTTPRVAPSPDTSVTWVRLRRNDAPLVMPGAWSGTRLPVGDVARGGPTAAVVVASDAWARAER
jgi:hypothetical protein